MTAQLRVRTSLFSMCTVYRARSETEAGHDVFPPEVLFYMTTRSSSALGFESPVAKFVSQRLSVQLHKD